MKPAPAMTPLEIEAERYMHQPPQSQQSQAAAKATPAVERRGRMKLIKEIDTLIADGKVKTLDELRIVLLREALHGTE